MAAATICSDFGGPNNKVCHCFHCFPIYLPWSDGTRCHDLSFLNVELKTNFFTLFFHFPQETLRSSLLSAIRVVSSVYLRLLIFLPEILIPVCASSSPEFHMIYSAYKLNKQGDNIQPWRTPFPIWNQSVVPRPVLTGDSWPAYRFYIIVGNFIFTTFLCQALCLVILWAFSMSNNWVFSMSNLAQGIKKDLHSA